MLFNSVEFGIFFPVVFIIYWCLNKRLQLQNFFILSSSYFFYGYWNWKFLFLIILSSFLDYFIGSAIYKTGNSNHKKILLFTSVFFNLGMLFYFKYTNFFIDSFNDSFKLLGSSFQISTLQIVLPVGISFYTFQTLSYSIDIYKNRLKPSNDLVSFLAYVAFFPQLVAGPIERARHLLPQFNKKRFFKYHEAMNGITQITWGLFKKIVIADKLAVYVNPIFDAPNIYSGSTLYLGGLYFTFQLYCDFSAYSDIAIGSGRILGFKLSKNFAYPFFSRDFSEIWRKWHISLTNWFRDYIYIPMTLGKNTTFHKIKNTFILFILIGLWHGASYNFVLFGIVNAIFLIPSTIQRKKWQTSIIAENKLLPSFKEVLFMTLTFSKIILIMIIFRSTNTQNLLTYFSHIFSLSIFSFPKVSLIPLYSIIVFMSIEWIGRRKNYAIEMITQQNSLLNWSCLSLIFLITALFKAPSNSEYIYFQF